MDISRIRDILSQRRETRQLYSKELIRVTGADSEIAIAGAYPDALLTALSVLTEDGSLYVRLVLIVDEWHAFIGELPTHIHVQTDRANSTIVGATINNLEPNQGVQGVFNTPIHIGKK